MDDFTLTPSNIERHKEHCKGSTRELLNTVKLGFKLLPNHEVGNRDIYQRQNVHQLHPITELWDVRQGGDGAFLNQSLKYVYQQAQPKEIYLTSR